MIAVVNNEYADRVQGIDPINPAQEILTRAAGILRANGLVVGPSETRYALLARADSVVGVERLIAAKGRNFNMPISVFLSDTAQIEREISLSEAARKLVDRFLPGPLTLVGNARRRWPRGISPGGTLGVRVSSSPFINGLLRATGFTLTATSANRSGEPDLEDIETITASFGEAVDFYIDGGLLAGPVSTVVDCIDDSVRVLREGAISAGQISDIAAGEHNE